MSSEELNKKMEFIIEQQAQFASDLGVLEGIVAQLAKATLNRFEDTEKRLNDVDDRIAALVDSQIRTEENIGRTEESVKQTNESLRNLITVVDRYFKDRNGKPAE
jgi:hypothetical protein